MAVRHEHVAAKKPDQLVYLELGSGNGGMLLSISEDGFRFRAVSPLRADGLVPFAFSLDGKHRLQGTGEIEWLEDDSKSGSMRFIEIPDDARALLKQWLAADSESRPSAREVTPAAETAPDTMEKIREELRRGYPTRAIDSGQQSAPNETEVGGRSSAFRNRIPKPAAAPQEEKSARTDLREKKTAESDPVQQKSAGYKAEPGRAAQGPLFPKFSEQETVRAEKSPEQPEVRREQAKPSTEHSPRPPAFSESDLLARLRGQRSIQSEVKETKEPPAPVFPTSSVPPGAPPAPSTHAPSVAEGSLRTFTLTESGDISGSSRNASSGKGAPDPPHVSTPVPPSRPRQFIPALDSPSEYSYDSAWETAQLSVPESPRLSRAAATSIIGLALVVILGALTFNFRQEIGGVVITLGKQISGQTQSTAAGAAPATSAPEQPVADSASPGVQNSESKPTANSPIQDPAKNKDETSPGSKTERSDDTAQSNEEPVPGPSQPSNERLANKGAEAKRKNPKTNAPAAKAPAASILASGPPVNSVVSEENLQSGETGSGEEEFNAAREILRSDNRQRDVARAVDLLWAGVRLGNVPAEVTLSDLYRRGEGVEKNCDQARVLLVAASKKGSPDARRMLEFMAEHGCE